MQITITRDIDTKDAPDYLKECLNKLALEDESKNLIRQYNTSYKLDDFFKRVFFDLDKLSMECDHFKAWAIMKAYYGFTVEYDSEKKIFEIGGYETEKLESKTLLGLIKQLEKRCK